jgi:hypothetical protein
MGESYSEGIVLDASNIEEMNPKNEKIVESNYFSKILNGGLLVQLKIPDTMDSSGIKKAIEKAGDLLGSFRPIRKVPICSNCGLKEEKIAEKCSVCKSPYILA